MLVPREAPAGSTRLNVDDHPAGTAGRARPDRLSALPPSSFETKKPNPEGLLTLIAEAERLISTLILPSETVMIGDSHVDVETARACGVRSLGCTFGLSPESLAAAGPDMSVDHANDWPRVLNLL